MTSKQKYSLLLAITIIGLFFVEKYVINKTKDYPEVTTTKVPSTEFSDAYLPKSNTGNIVSHTFYTLSYNEAYEQAAWVAYELQKNQLSQNDFKRPYFVQDKLVKTKSADWRNYKNSGYDRGHLCPAGDRRFAYDAYYETFLTSNIAPQNHDFNAGIWNKLEQKVRYWANKYDGVYVITGGVLKKGLKTIGDEHVAVPEYFYKIIVDASKGKHKAIAFLIPNKPTNQSFYEYVVSIDKIEEETGIDFFYKLPDTIENPLESQVNLKAWGRW